MSDEAPAPAPVPERLVLYVEDEVDNWNVTQLQLGKKYRLVWAKTAREACVAVRMHQGAFHAILMDIQLRGSELDGIELTRALRRRTPAEKLPGFARDLPLVDCPIFFVTANGHAHSPTILKQAGGDSVVPKPVDFFKLTNLLVSIRTQRVLSSLKAIP